MTKRLACRGGVTLLEIMVAIVIILLVLLTLLGTVSFSLEGARNAEGHQDAEYYAQSLFEAIRDRDLAQGTGFSDAATDRIPLNDPPFAGDFPADTGYTRNIVTTQLATDPADYRSKLYEVQVVIHWKVKNRENSFRLVGMVRD